MERLSELKEFKVVAGKRFKKVGVEQLEPALLLTFKTLVLRYWLSLHGTSGKAICIQLYAVLPLPRLWAWSQLLLSQGKWTTKIV